MRDESRGSGASLEEQPPKREKPPPIEECSCSLPGAELDCILPLRYFLLRCLCPVVKEQIKGKTYSQTTLEHFD